MAKPKKSSDGGKAEAVGADYETRAAAWYCVRMLAGPAGQILGLPAGITFTTIGCQTGAAVDDVNAATSQGGLVYAQAKRTIHLSDKPASPLVKALDQFVRQYKECEEKSSKHAPRPLDPATDRMALVTRRAGSKKVIDVLDRLLRAVRFDASKKCLADAQTSAEEKEVAETVDRVLRARWQAAYGNAPTPDQLAGLLRLIWVQSLDVQDGQTDAIAAQDSLTASVLATPTSAGTAFATIIKTCATLRADRASIDLRGLQEALTDNGIELVALPAYRNDVAALKKWAEARLRIAHRYTRLLEDEPKTAIKREVLTKLRTAAGKDDLLLVGDPGAGKSGLTYALASHFASKGGDVLFLPVDRLEANGLADVWKELGIARPLDEVLQNWPGNGPGLVIIDALDAAKSPKAQKVIGDIIDAITSVPGGRWNVVASVRSYDVKHGAQWRTIFRGKPPIPEHVDPGLGLTKHVYVKALSAAEIEQTAKALPQLQALYAGAAPELRRLLQNIFNLHLLADLLSHGVKKSELSPLRTQSQLLAEYWTHRVHQEDGKHDAREKVLGATVEEMLAKKSLRAARADVLAKADAAALVELEKADILRQDELPGGGAKTDILLFTHHILFDYAVARLIFRAGRDPAQLVARLTADRTLAVMASPSLRLVMQETWADGGTRAAFWTLAVALAAEAGLPEVARLAAPNLAATETKKAEDLQPLYDALKVDAPGSANFLQHMITALLMRNGISIALLGNDAGPWMAVAERLSEIPTDAAMSAVRILMVSAQDKPAVLTPAQLKSAGAAARRLLDYGWNRASRWNVLVDVGLMAVAETISSDKNASVALLRRSLKPDQLKAFGHSEMHTLCRHIKSIGRDAPEFMVEMYEAIYGFQETSTEKTGIGNSAILAMTSHRRQDYEMAWWGLQEAFPHLLDTDLPRAMEALTKAVTAYNKREHPGPHYGKPLPGQFTANGKKFKFHEDLSHIWFRGGFQDRRDAPALIAKFEEALARPATATEKANFQIMVNTVGREGGPAVLWASLINHAANRPLLARIIASVVAAKPILLSADTRYAIGRYLAQAYAALSKPQRHAIETAILGLTGKVGRHYREIYANTIPAGLAATAGMKMLQRDLAASGIKPANTPPSGFEFSGRVYDTDTYLERQGVDLKSTPVVALRTAEKAAQALPQESSGNQITAKVISERLPVIEALHAAVLQAKKDGVDPAAIEHAEGIIAQTATTLCLAPVNQVDDAHRGRLSALLLFASQSAYPHYKAEIEEQFKKSVSWGGPSARTSAAMGLMLLARQPFPASPGIQAAITKAARDPVGSVRYQVIERLRNVFKDRPDWVYQEIEHAIRNDPADTVVCAAINVLGSVTLDDIPRAMQLIKLVFDRFGQEDDDDGEKCISFAINLIADLAIGHGVADAQTILDGYVGKIASYPGIIKGLVARNSDKLMIGNPSDPSDAKHAIRKRAFGFYIQVADAARAERDKIAGGRSVKVSGTWSAQDQDDYREMLSVLDQIAMRLLHCSGGGYNKGTTEPTALQERLFQDAAPIIERLLDIGFPHATHNIVQYLERFIPVDPAGVFAQLVHAVRMSEAFGYSVEQLAADEIVGIVDEYLADHRNVFGDQARLKDLVDLLDILIRAGWPRAQELSFRLVEIWH